MNDFLKIFVSSPFKVIQQHMDIAYKSANILINFMEYAYLGDWQAARKLRAQIVELENDADKLKRELRLHLPKTLFLPVGRSDLLELITAQDKIANKVKDISSLVIGRQLRIPEPIGTKYKELLHRSVNATAQAHKVINELDELLNSGFKGKEVTLVANMIKDLEEIEQDTDNLQDLIRAMLFEIERDFAPVDVVFLYKVLDWTGDLADLSQQAAHRLQVMLAK